MNAKQKDALLAWAEDIATAVIEADPAHAFPIKMSHKALREALAEPEPVVRTEEPRKRIATLAWNNGSRILRVAGVTVLREDDPCRDMKFGDCNVWSVGALERLCRHINAMQRAAKEEGEAGREALRRYEEEKNG